VVRRVQAPPGQIAVGVRGVRRNERWGGLYWKFGIKKISRPEELLVLSRTSPIALPTPALNALRKMDERWRHVPLSWGPVGSVGFELATGWPATNESSDLDLIIRAPDRLDSETARSLWNDALGLGVRADVLVETPDTGFSLEEYATNVSKHILLRRADGMRISDDPWARGATLSAHLSGRLSL
jgi:phosphoribosyl-dephospho-CoA transferase